jgi:FlgD Ig-like domain
MPRFTPRVFFLTALLMTLHAEASAGPLPHYWSARFGDGDSQSITSVARDGFDNVIVVGTFKGTVNFGGFNLVSAGDNDIFVAKFDAGGVHQWSRSFGGLLSQEGRAVKTDNTGSIIIAGHFQGTFDIDGFPFTSAGGTDVYLCKLSPGGTFVWGLRFGDASFQYCSALAVDAANNLAISGAFLGSILFGGGNTLTSAGDYDAFVAKFNPAGVHQWSKRFGDANWQDSSCITMTGIGDVIIGGHFDGTFSFGGPNVTGLYDIFIAKFDTAGNYQWSKDFGDGASQYCSAIAIDLSQNVIITGHTYGTVNFGGSDLSGVADVFVAKFDAAGTHQWSKSFGDTNFQTGWSLAIDASSNVIVAGHFFGWLTFGSGLLVSMAGHDLFLVKFAPGGEHLWSYQYGDAAAQEFPCVAIRSLENIIIAGNFQGSINFGGSVLTSAGSHDAFVARLADYPLEPIIASVLDIGNDQGGKVKIRFTRSAADHENWFSSPIIVRYDVFRRDDPPPAANSAATDRDGVLIDGWTQVGSVSAYTENSYGIDVPTIGDSTIATGEYFSTFFIRAATYYPNVFYDSNPAWGHSLDNLAPGVPTGFAYFSGQLVWNGSGAVDFDYFAVYGGDTNSFGSSTLIAYTTDNQLNVGGSPYAYYFVTATDFSGNESGVAVLDLPTDVEGTRRSYVLSVSAYPNPFNPQTTIRYTVPSKGRVEVSVFDLRGAHVATLVDEEKDAGAYTRAWDGRSTGGNAASSGVYFARMTHPSGTKSYKLVLLK